MFRVALQKLVPVLRPASRCIVRAPNRNIWDLRPTNNFRSLMRDLDRQMERFEREVFDRFPLRKIAPRFIPVAGTTDPMPFRMNIDVGDFKPEELNVAVKGKVLSIRGKMERNAEDGSKFYQEVVRELTLPEAVEETNLKSFLNTDGVLTVEAPLKPAEKPKEIPVSREKLDSK